MRVLAVEYDEDAAAWVLGGLRRLGHQVTLARSGAAALAELTGHELVLLDFDLPDMDGVAICRAIRAAGDTPVIGFSAKAGETERVLGLEAGADDCMAKPFGLRELAARMDAIMRRVRPADRPNRTVRYDGLHIDAALREVIVDDRPVTVTRKEFDLLYLLAAQPERIFRREELMARVWNESQESAARSARASRTLDTHIATLRNKIGQGRIVTVRGVGFRFSAGRRCRSDLDPVA